MIGLRITRLYIYEGGVFPNAERRKRIEAFIAKQIEEKHNGHCWSYRYSDYRLDFRQCR